MNIEEWYDHIYLFMILNLTKEAFWKYKALVPKAWVQILNLLLTSYVIQTNSFFFFLPPPPQTNSLTSKLQVLYL